MKTRIFFLVVLLGFTVSNKAQSQTTVYNWGNAPFGASGTQAKQFTIGRMYYNEAHWGNYGSMRIKLFSYYLKSAYVEYIVLSNPGNNGNYPEISCVSAKGFCSQSVKLSLGAVTSAATTYAGANNYYRDILLDVSDYTSWSVEAEASGPSFAVDKTSITAGEYTTMTLFSSPASANIASFTLAKEFTLPTEFGTLTIPINTKITGKLGIGASPRSTEQISVDGNISTKKLIVTQLGWSDYVFNDDYKLRSLSSLESFIKRNKHLPDIPSAKEVEENGISVGDNQALLLKKIEELTLYLLQQQKQIEKQAQTIAQLSAKINSK